MLSGSLASGIAYVASYFARPGLTTTRAAIVQLAVPVVAASGGVILRSEGVSLRLLISGVLILGGVAIASSSHAPCRHPAIHFSQLHTIALVCNDDPSSSHSHVILSHKPMLQSKLAHIARMPITHSQWTGLRDRFGDRDVIIDSNGQSVSRLRVSSTLAVDESALADRITRLQSFDRSVFSRPLDVDHDPVTDRPVLVSEYVSGLRLTEVLQHAMDRGLVADLAAALFVIRRLLTAAERAQGATGLNHFGIAPERVIVTPRAEVVIIEAAIAAAVDSRIRAGTAPPGTHEDIASIARIGVSMVLGRLISEDHYIDPLSQELADVAEVATIRADETFASVLRLWFEQALVTDPNLSFRDFASAREAFDVPSWAGCHPSRVAFRDFLTDLAVEDSFNPEAAQLEARRIKAVRARHLEGIPLVAEPMVVESTLLPDGESDIGTPHQSLGVVDGPAVFDAESDTSSEQEGTEESSHVEPQSGWLRRMFQHTREVERASTAEIPVELSPDNVAESPPDAPPEPSALDVETDTVGGHEDEERLIEGVEPIVAHWEGVTTPPMADTRSLDSATWKSDSAHEPVSDAPTDARAGYEEPQVASETESSLETEESTRPSWLRRAFAQARDRRDTFTPGPTHELPSHSEVDTLEFEPAARADPEGPSDVAGMPGVDDPEEPRLGPVRERAAGMTGAEVVGNDTGSTEADGDNPSTEEPLSAPTQAISSEWIRSAIAQLGSLEPEVEPDIVAEERAWGEIESRDEEETLDSALDASVVVDHSAAQTELVTGVDTETPVAGGAAEDVGEATQPVRAGFITSWLRGTVRRFRGKDADPQQDSNLDAQLGSGPSDGWEAAWTISSDDQPAFKSLDSLFSVKAPAADVSSSTQSDFESHAETPAAPHPALSRAIEPDADSAETAETYDPLAALVAARPRNDSRDAMSADGSNTDPEESNAIAELSEEEELPRESQLAPRLSAGWLGRLMSSRDESETVDAPSHVPNEDESAEPGFQATSVAGRIASTLSHLGSSIATETPAPAPRPSESAQATASAIAHAYLNRKKPELPKHQPQPSEPLTAVPEKRKSGGWLKVVAVFVLVAGLGYGTYGFRELIPAPETGLPEGSTEEPAETAAIAPPTSGSLTITSTPPGARITIDGTSYGVTPLTVADLPLGGHSVLLEGSTGSVYRSVTIQPGVTASIDEAIFSGFLAVFAPFEIDILEQGRRVGTNDSSRIMLPPGRHELELVNTRVGFRETRVVNIRPGETEAINILPQ